MMESDDSNICRNCVGDTYLKKLIAEQGDPGECSYCDANEAVVEIDWLADQVRAALDAHYRHTSSEPYDLPMEWIKEGFWEREGEPIVSVIAEMLKVDETPIASDVRKNLDDRFSDWDLAKMGVEEQFDEEAHYAWRHPDHEEYLEAWSELETTLRTESRYFNRRAEEVLELVFDDVETISISFDFTAVKTGGPRRPFNSVFRGRMARDDAGLKKILAAPERELGAPPKGMASAGRMNASGVSVFYGANAPETVLAEVRPPVGSRVVISRFQFSRDMKFLDIAGFDQARAEGSVFDPEHLRRLKQIGFLRHLSGRLTRPVLPGDEVSEYIVTQAVAEFLSKRFDGLIFPSVQAGQGFNVALFNEAAIVQPAQKLPEGTRIEVSCFQDTEDGPEPDYYVREIMPKDTEVTVEADADESAALSLERNTVQVHYIHSVTYNASSQFSRWHQYQELDDSVF